MQPTKALIAQLAMSTGYETMWYLKGIVMGAEAAGNRATQLISSADFRRRALAAKCRGLIEHDHLLIGE